MGMAYILFYKTILLIKVLWGHSIITFYRKCGIVSKRRLFEKEGEVGGVKKWAGKKQNRP